MELSSSCEFIQFLLRFDPRFYLFDHSVELLLALFVGLGVDVVGFALDRSYTMTAPKDSETAGRRGYRLQRKTPVRSAGLRYGICGWSPDVHLQKTGPPSRAEPGKCNAPDHRFYRR